MAASNSSSNSSNNSRAKQVTAVAGQTRRQWVGDSLDDIHHATVITRRDMWLAPVRQCDVGMHSVCRHTCLGKRTCMTSMSIPPVAAGSKRKLRDIKVLLLIKNRTNALALGEHMNSSNYGHHWEWFRLLSLRGCRIITHSR